jgi:hypothetical protein
MKFAGLGVFSAARNSGSDADAVVRKCEHLLALLMSAKVKKPKWSAPLGGLKLHVPDPEASSAKACHVSPADSSRSMMFGALMPQQQ